MELQRLLWLFFGFSGRIDRRAFALAGLLLYLVRAYPVYRIAMAGGVESEVVFWFEVLVWIFGALLVSHLALCVKRLHDFGYSGWLSLLFIVGDIFVFLILCMPNSMPGPNKYGRRPNAPAGG